MIIEPTKEVYSDLSYSECILKRDEMFKSLVDYEKSRTAAESNCFPSAETIYKSHMQSLIYVCEAMLDKLDGDELMSDFECAQIIHGLLETGR